MGSQQATSRDTSVQEMHMSIKMTVALASFLVLAGCSRNTSETELPKEWAGDIKGKSIGEIKLLLGEPTEDASAKGYFNWIQPSNSGRRVLKLLCSAECKSDEKPASILFLVYRDASSSQIYSRELLHIK
jgi:hypothetical protein